MPTRWRPRPSLRGRSRPPAVALSRRCPSPHPSARYESAAGAFPSSRDGGGYRVVPRLLGEGRRRRRRRESEGRVLRSPLPAVSRTLRGRRVSPEGRTPPPRRPLAASQDEGAGIQYRRDRHGFSRISIERGRELSNGRRFVLGRLGPTIRGQRCWERGCVPSWASWQIFVRSPPGGGPGADRSVQADRARRGGSGTPLGSEFGRRLLDTGQCARCDNQLHEGGGEESFLQKFGQRSRGRRSGQRREPRRRLHKFLPCGASTLAGQADQGEQVGKR